MGIEADTGSRVARKPQKHSKRIARCGALIGGFVFLAIAVAPIASANWTSIGAKNGCEFYKGAAVGALAPMRAVCDWPISADKVIRALDRTGDLELVFSTIDQSSIVGPDPTGGELVYQSYRKTIFFRREVVLAIFSEPIPGGRRLLWVKADDQSALSGEHTEIDQVQNRWEVTGTADSCHLVLEMSFAPGGKIPGFLIDWFQGAGIKEQIADLRSYAVSN